MAQPPMGGQGHMPPALPMHSHRRDQYHYHHHPQSPMQSNFYPGYHSYYTQQAPYRWQPPYPQQHYVPPPHMQQPQYQPRSPMVVSSQPQPQPHAQAITPVTRQQNPMPNPPQSTQSPRPIPPYMHQQKTPVAASPAPQPEEQRPETPAQPTRRPSTATNPLALPPQHKEPFWPNLPWYSTPEGRSAFPARAVPRRRRRRNLRSPNAAVSLPTKDEVVQDEVPASADSQAPSAKEPASETSTIAAPSEPETPATSQAPSESEYTHASTSSTPAQASTSSPKATATQQHGRRDTRTAIAVPAILGLPKAKEASPPATVVKQEQRVETQDSAHDTQTVKAEQVAAEKQPAADESLTLNTPPTKPAGPKSWAELLRRNTKPEAPSAIPNGEVVPNGFQLPKSAPLAEALKQYNVRGDTKISFIEPRGLVNTGNMCYMNSILQVLIFCVPFYNFLEQVRQRTAHSLKSDTPLVDAMIMFMTEFKGLASAESVVNLRSMLKQEQLEQFGDPITPDYVYNVIRKLPRFAGMRRGHQQDAEEFLGFLLEGLHDECVKVMQGQADDRQQANGATSPSTVTSPESTDGWMEVGPKQKASVTRTAGQEDEPSPITKIFGGKLRSELRVPGQKDSVTLEPYKPLQLDIGAQHVNNIVDALKGLTRTEALTGDFGGRGTTAKKQVFIDTLPQVLILHLKRFQYDNSFSGTQKIWKKVGYPLELEIPKEVFPPAKRGGLAVHGGLPKYRLTSVVYHHGTSAAGGHYTVDVLREDNRDWIRMDDTIIRRIRPEDVAEGGAEEDPKILAKALEQHKADQELQKQRNMYQGLDEAEKQPEEEKPWNEVNGGPGHAKKWSAQLTSSVANTNGTSTPTSTTGKKTPTARKEGVRDNKVAYILLYERIHD